MKPAAMIVPSEGDIVSKFLSGAKPELRNYLCANTHDGICQGSLLCMRGNQDKRSRTQITSIWPDKNVSTKPAQLAANLKQ